MIYVLAETWGLCDFRGIRGPFQTADEAAAAWRALEHPDGARIAADGVDGGVADDPHKLGTWISAQDGMVAPHASREEAIDWLRTNSGTGHADGAGRYVAECNAEEGSGPVYVGRVVRIVCALSTATCVVVECDPADVLQPEAIAALPRYVPPPAPPDEPLFEVLAIGYRADGVEGKAISARGFCDWDLSLGRVVAFMRNQCAGTIQIFRATPAIRRRYGFSRDAESWGPGHYIVTHGECPPPTRHMQKALLHEERRDA